MGRTLAGGAESGKILRCLNASCVVPMATFTRSATTRAGCRHLARAAAVKQGVAQCMAVDADGVESAADFGQHIVLVHERGMHAKDQPVVASWSAIASSLIT